MPPKIRSLLTLARVSNLPTVWTNCLAGWVLGGGGIDWHFIPLLIGASLIYSAGMMLNDAADAKWDAENRPERPIPSGAISVTAAYGFSIVAFILGFGILCLAETWVLWAILLVAAVVAYDLLHKRWAGSVYVMGTCRFLLYLCAASAGATAGTGNALAPLVIIWGAALGVYTVGITVVAKGESSDAPLDKLGLALLAAPLVAGFITLLMRDQSDVMGLVCLTLWLGWTVWSIVVMRGDAEGRIGRGVSHLLAGIVLLDASAVAPAFGWLGLGMAVMLPSVVMLQRKVAAT